MGDGLGVVVAVGFRFSAGTGVGEAAGAGADVGFGLDLDSVQAARSSSVTASNKGHRETLSMTLILYYPDRTDCTVRGTL